MIIVSEERTKVANSDLIQQYLERITGTLQAVLQQEEVERAGVAIADSLANQGMLHIFGTGHSHMLAEEAFYRAGGLVQIDAILDTALMLHESAIKSTELERLPGYAQVVLTDRDVRAGDVFIIASNSGRNAVPVEMAELAKERGCFTVAITSLEHSGRVTSRAPSGKKLYEVADLVIDTKAPYGDACLEIPGLGSMGPISSIISMTVLNSMLAVAANTLVSRGQSPQLFVSSNVEGSSNQSHLGQFVRGPRRG